MREDGRKTAEDAPSTKPCTKCGGFDWVRDGYKPTGAAKIRCRHIMPLTGKFCGAERTDHSLPPRGQMQVEDLNIGEVMELATKPAKQGDSAVVKAHRKEYLKNPTKFNETIAKLLLIERRKGLEKRGRLDCDEPTQRCLDKVKEILDRFKVQELATSGV